MKIASRRFAAFLPAVIASTAFAQVSFAPATSLSPGPSPVAVAVADVSGDGKADIVATNGFSAPGAVAVFTGDGTGGFASPIMLTTGTNPFAVAIADFNRDGLPDLAVAVAGAAQVAILLGTGAGSFGAPTTFAVGNSAQSIVAADFNGDGHVDLAVACQGANFVSVLLGNGNGTFAAATNFAVMSPFALAVADVNGDRNADLVAVGSFASAVTVLIGDGAGGFAAQPPIFIGNTVNSVAVADLDKDGRADLVLARGTGVSGGAVVVLRGNGNGTFAAPVSFPLVSQALDVAIADFDGDGNADVAATLSNATLVVLPGNGSGGLGTASTFSIGSDPRSLAIGDFNGDAKADVVTANHVSGTVSVLLNTTPFVVSAQSWGTGETGELGNGVFGANSATPVNVLNLDAIAAVSAGFSHTLALRADGTAWAWGADWGGPLGDGGFSDHQAVPVQVIDSSTLAPLTNVVAVSAGDDHSMAIRADGTLWGWGNNLHGQTGTGIFLHDTHAALVVPGIDDVVAVSAGMGYSLVLKADGTVWSFGWNTFGQLGDGTLGSERYTPVPVSGLANVIAISASSSGWHSLAVKSDGTVWGWGRNDRGQLGDGTTVDRLSPVQVNALTGARSVVAGNFHSLAVKADGSVWAWGDNFHGQLGDGTTTPRTVPVQVSGLGSVAAVAAGQSLSVALKADGTVWSWGGNNWSGQLGDGTFNSFDRTSPGQVTGITAATALSTGGQHSVVILKGMTVAAMLQIVQSLNLTPAASNALVATLSAAQSAYQAGNTMAACAQVGAFGRQVRAFSGRQVPTADADRLLGGARRLEATLGCR